MIPKPEQPALPLPIPHAHQRLLTERDQRALRRLDRKHLQLADGERATGTHHLPDCLEIFALGRRQKIDFELDRQHGVVGWELRQPGVPASTIGNRTGAARMKISVLLRELRPERQANDDPAPRHGVQGGPKQRHQPLPIEAGGNARFDRGI